MAEKLACLCCGGEKNLRYAPIMTGFERKAPVCSQCISIWYDYGLTDSDAIAAKSAELKTAKLWPWRDEDIAQLDKEELERQALIVEAEAKERSEYERLKAKFGTV